MSSARAITHAAARPSLFRSFWLAGYEGADHINGCGELVDMNSVTQHGARPLEDYLLLQEFGIRTVRESVGWRLVEHDGAYDFSSVDARARAAARAGIQVAWTLCHYGWPHDLDLFSPSFVSRFAAYCHAVAEHLAPLSSDPPIYSPINEISFLSWASCDSRLINPYKYIEVARPRSFEAKQQLVRAAIAGCDAIWSADPRARILHADPMIHLVAPQEQPELAAEAQRYRVAQFQAWDMLCGKLCPELGGAPRYLDIVGVNYYHDNQWEVITNKRLHWHLRDRRRMPLSRMLVEAYERYGRPLVIGETSHVGRGRGKWIKEIAAEVAAARRIGAPVEAICIYPIIDRPDWDDLSRWHYSGLWDIRHQPDGRRMRVLNQRYARDLRIAQQTVHTALSTTTA